MKSMFKKHLWILVACVALGSALLFYLFCEFKCTHVLYPSGLFSFFLALFLALGVYVLVDSQTSRKIEQIQMIEKNIEQNTIKLITANTQIDKNIKQTDNNIHNLKFEIDRTSKIQNHVEQNTQNLIKSNEIITDNIRRTAFQVEKRATIYKYPESEQYKKINEIYQPFVIALFDYEKPIIGIEINPNNPQEDLKYEIEVVKNEDNTPRKATALYSTFYIIKILAPAHSEVLTEEDLQKYKYSPIKEGEYYACRLDQNQYSWVLGEKLSLGQIGKGFYKFYLAGSGILGGVIPSANEIMGYGKDPDDTYQFAEFLVPFSVARHPITDQSVGLPMPKNNQNPQNVTSIQYEILCKLLKKNNQIFLKIRSSPLKKVYVMETYTGTLGGSYFMVFENLRGHIMNDSIITALKNNVFLYIKNIPHEIRDTDEYRENHHIKIPLDTKETNIVKQHQSHL